MTRRHTRRPLDEGAARRVRPIKSPMEAGWNMLLVAVAFVVGGVLGAVITAALIAANRRALSYDDFDLPVRPANEWAADAAAEQYHDSPRMERFERELAARLGREAAGAARQRALAARRALQPHFGISVRVKP